MMRYQWKYVVRVENRIFQQFKISCEIVSTEAKQIGFFTNAQNYQYLNFLSKFKQQNVTSSKDWTLVSIISSLTLSFLS